MSTIEMALSRFCLTRSYSSRELGGDDADQLTNRHLRSSTVRDLQRSTTDERKRFREPCRTNCAEGARSPKPFRAVCCLLDRRTRVAYGIAAPEQLGIR